MEIIKSFELAPLFNLNTPDTQTKIIDIINSIKTIHEHDHGYVYGFLDTTDDNTKYNFYMKLGRTERKGNARLVEWEKHIGHEILPVFSIVCSRHKIFERLVHLLFRFAHVNRLRNMSRELEWFRFTKDHSIGGKKITQNIVAQYTAKIAEMIDEIVSDDDIVSESKSEPVLVLKPKPVETPVTPVLIPSKSSKIAPKIKVPIKLNDETKATILDLERQYNNSSRFHVEKKRLLFDILQKLHQNDSDGVVQSLEKQRELLDMRNIYYDGSGHVHVSQRRELFDSLRAYF